MDTNKVAEIVASILYLDNADALDRQASLFRDYGMSSIDFIDLAFELKTHSGKNFVPDDLWPVNWMMTDPDYFDRGAWTEQGLSRLRELFGTSSVGENPSASDLYALFSIAFVSGRLAKL